MLVIGFTGLPCSGKDAACEYLVKNHGYNFLSCGDVVRKFAREVRKIENPDRHQLQQIGFLVAQDRLVSILKQVPVTPVPSVELLGVARQ